MSKSEQQARTSIKREPRRCPEKSRESGGKLQARPTRKVSNHEKKTRTSITNEHHKQTTKIVCRRSHTRSRRQQAVSRAVSTRSKSGSEQERTHSKHERASNVNHEDVQRSHENQVASCKQDQQARPASTRRKHEHQPRTNTTNKQTKMVREVCTCTRNVSSREADSNL